MTEIVSMLRCTPRFRNGLISAAPFRDERGGFAAISGHRLARGGR